MNERDKGKVRRKTGGRVSAVEPERTYRPSRKPERAERSPYPLRTAKVEYPEETDSAEESEGSVESLQSDLGEVEPERRVSMGEESEVTALLKYMMKRDEDERDRMRTEADEERKRRREEEDRRMAAEEEREAKRHERELELAAVQRDNRRADVTERARRELLCEKLKGLGNYKEGGELKAYLDKFERIMREGEIPKREWGERLHARLPDGLSVRVAEARDEELEYDQVKEMLLRSVGETAITYGNQLMEVTGDSLKGKNAGEIEEWFKRVTSGVFRDCKTAGDYGLAMTLTVLRRVLPQSGKTFLELRKLNTWGELRCALEDWLSGRQRGNYFKPLGASEGPAQKGGGVSKKPDGRSGGSLKCFACGEVGHRAADCRSGSGVSSGIRGGLGGSVPRPLTCFTCGKEGHKSPECPQKKVGGTVKKEVKVNVVGAVGRDTKTNVVWGLVNGVVSRVLIDSGADVGVVPRSVVPEGAQSLGEINVVDVHGRSSVHSSFMVCFEFGGVQFKKLAVVKEQGEGRVSCIVPYNIRDRVEREIFAKAIDNEAVKPVNVREVSVLTRAQSRIEEQLDVCEGDATVGDLWCRVPPGGGVESSSHPDPLKSPEVSSKVGEGHGADGAKAMASTDKPQAKDKTIVSSDRDNGLSESEEGVPVPLEKDSTCESDVEVNVRRLADSIGFVGEGKDGDRFREELMSDSSLKAWRDLGTSNERGFSWKKGALVRSQFVEWDTFRDLLVVPKVFRSQIMELGHEKNGHLCGDKVVGMIGKYFVWPGMAKEVCEYCASCEVCQVRSKHKPRRAPIVERPVLTEPFESVAVDLVGPLPKGKGGCRYLLTCVCLATRWPEAVPLRSITAKAVAEGLWEIFSRTAIPEKILSDQGSQFCSRLVKELCELLGIDRVRTSLYHPQSNGTVERMHATFKGILGKCVEKETDWVGQVNFVLYVLRQMPHADSGMAPFDLVLGFRARTPLDALYHGLFEAESTKLNVCEWVRCMTERLEQMRECAAVKMLKERASRMEYANKGAKLREFSKGDRVFHRVPGLNSKLSDSWEGPYVVLERKGKVNYRIAREGKERHSRVVHVNCLKKYRERLGVNRLDVVLEEGESERSVLSGECEGFTECELTHLLEEYTDVFSDKPGNTSKVLMRIDTGEAEPIRQMPYSVPLGTREKVAEELKSLEEQGIIERCDSCWASPLVPVKKPDGSIRLCVDFRKVNEVTKKEPYYMPGFEEMVELIGTGKVLSKVDLAKGFYQVQVEEGDRDKTCFICPFGKFRFIRMPFGLTNAPSVFQRLMEGVLVECVDFCKVYIDDILVVSKDWEEHMWQLRKLFGVLREAGLTCKRKKCSFGRWTLEFLGHQVGDGVISVPLARVKAIQEHPLPRTRKQLKAFLGMVGYYRRFIRGYHKWSFLLTPHTSSLQHGRVSWTEPMLEAFHGLCNELCNAVCLCIPIVSDVFVLECDASSTGVGAALSVDRGGELLPVAFFSRQLRGAQMRYSAQELEGLAMYEAIRHFAYYLYGRRFKVITDHKGLLGLRSGRQENRRVYNWALKLTEFEFDIEYRDGKLNVVADNLSRCHEGDGAFVKDESSARSGTDLSKEEGEMWAHKKSSPT